MIFIVKNSKIISFSPFLKDFVLSGLVASIFCLSSSVERFSLFELTFVDRVEKPVFGLVHLKIIFALLFFTSFVFERFVCLLLFTYLGLKFLDLSFSKFKVSA